MRTREGLIPLDLRLKSICAFAVDFVTECHRRRTGVVQRPYMMLFVTLYLAVVASGAPPIVRGRCSGESHTWPVSTSCS